MEGSHIPKGPLWGWLLKSTMEFYLYILRSLDNKHWYIGSTQNLDDRIKRHNAGRNKSTKPFKPWIIVHKEIYTTKTDAIKREYFLKSTKGYLEYQFLKRKILEGRIA